MLPIILYYFFIGFLCFTFIAFVVGLLLPEERVSTQKTEFNAPLQKVYSVVTDNKDWSYRTNLKELKIIESCENFEVWEEIGKNGSVIRFKTQSKTPNSFYSFYLKSRFFTGYWAADFKETENNATLFTATEYVQLKNPFVKSLSYLFFDINKFMNSYQEDLRAKLSELK